MYKNQNRLSILLFAAALLLAPESHVLALESGSFQIFAEFSNYADRAAKTSDSFSINEDGMTWYELPEVSDSFQITTSQDEPKDESGGATGGGGTGGDNGGGRREESIDRLIAEVTEPPVVIVQEDEPEPDSSPEDPTVPEEPRAEIVTRPPESKQPVAKVPEEVNYATTTQEITAEAEVWAKLMRQRLQFGNEVASALHTAAPEELEAVCANAPQQTCCVQQSDDWFWILILILLLIVIIAQLHLHHSTRCSYNLQEQLFVLEKEKQQKSKQKRSSSSKPKKRA